MDNYVNSLFLLKMCWNIFIKMVNYKVGLYPLYYTSIRPAQCADYFYLLFMKNMQNHKNIMTIP